MSAHLLQRAQYERMQRIARCSGVRRATMARSRQPLSLRPELVDAVLDWAKRRPCCAHENPDPGFLPAQRTAAGAQRVAAGATTWG